MRPGALQIHYQWDSLREVFLHEAEKDNGYVDIGAVLRISPIKDVKTLLYAFADLRSRISNVRLYIAGPEDDEEYAKECYDLKEQLGLADAYFLGTVNILEYMENLILPSLAVFQKDSRWLFWNRSLQEDPAL